MTSTRTKEYKNDIVIDAYYLISLFNGKNIKITQIQVQKLMYLFEGYYMNVKRTTKLYDCAYKAWNLGPVSTPLYKEFKNCGKSNIELTEEQRQLAENISNDKKMLLRNIFEVFNKFDEKDLINFIRNNGSPWKNAWNYEEYSEIHKDQLKNWFSQYVLQ